MKMKTIEQKAKAYDEALERMKSWAKGEHPECFAEAQKAAEFIFPELKESEDERIRKAILKHIQFCTESIPDRDKFITWLEKQGTPQDKGEISDGYHTFNELYYYRMLYNAAFFNMLPKEWVHKSKKHHDGEDCFGGGWFIVMANLPTGQISNHYELKNWDLFQIPEKEVADKWDGHTPQEAADRLHKYLLEKQGEQKPTKNLIERWKDMRLEVYQQASGNRHEPNYSDETTKIFSLNDIDEIIEKMSEQNHADKVEPKFKVGDLVKDTNHHRKPIYKIVHIDKECYICESDDVTLGDKAIMHFAFDNPYLRLVEQKPAWSKEDETKLRQVEYACMKFFGGDCSHVGWLRKSLKERFTWKPSEEQIEALEHFVRSIGESGYASPYDNHTKLVYSLLLDLKKLK